MPSCHVTNKIRYKNIMSARIAIEAIEIVEITGSGAALTEFSLGGKITSAYLEEGCTKLSKEGLTKRRY